jgi:hypothetical protein
MPFEHVDRGVSSENGLARGLAGVPVEEGASDGVALWTIGPESG